MSDILNKYKGIFNGFNNMIDINKMSKIMNLKIDEQLIINNYYTIVNLPNIIPYEDFQSLIIRINKLKYREDIYENIYKLKSKINNIQINTLLRIANTKPNKPYHVTLTDIKEKNKYSLLKKKCPHCFHENIISEFKNYVICGYNDIANDGYDWKGCGKDWCFSCGKKLCKKWSEDNLFLLENQFHDTECCLIHCKKNGLNYNLDYCQCQYNSNNIKN